MSDVVKSPALDCERVELAGGRAVLWRGDCLELLAAGALAGADAVVSAPPYGIGFQHGGGGKRLSPVNNASSAIAGDDRPFDPQPWVQYVGDENGIGKPLVLLGADHFMQRLPAGGRMLCWDKSVGQGAATSFSEAEFGWTNRRNARNVFRHFWMGGLRSGQGAQSREPRHHQSQKPVELMAWLIEHARIGVSKVVLDPYMGSGSTGVAALQSGRRFVGVEIEQRHFDTACRRIEALGL